MLRTSRLADSALMCFWRFPGLPSRSTASATADGHPGSPDATLFTCFAGGVVLGVVGVMGVVGVVGVAGRCAACGFLGSTLGSTGRLPLGVCRTGGGCTVPADCIRAAGRQIVGRESCFGRLSTYDDSEVSSGPENFA